MCLPAILSPNLNKKTGTGTLNFIEDIIIDMKQQYKDPYLLVAGYFNQWDVTSPLSEFRVLTEVLVGNTRNSRCIDRIFLNMGRSLIESGTHTPLETEGEGEEKSLSDHRVAYCKVSLPRKESFVWESYSYRHYNDKSVNKFKAWILNHDWRDVFLG